MKKMISATFIVVMLILTSVPALAKDSPGAPDMITDVLLLRPVGLVFTVIGTAAFIVVLPFAITSGSVKPAAQTLVASPFKLTFERPLGDFTSLEP